VDARARAAELKVGEGAKRPIRLPAADDRPRRASARRRERQPGCVADHAILSGGLRASPACRETL
jgi:hypothetical protein